MKDVLKVKATLKTNVQCLLVWSVLPCFVFINNFHPAYFRPISAGILPDDHCLRDAGFYLQTMQMSWAGNCFRGLRQLREFLDLMKWEPRSRGFQFLHWLLII